MGRWGITFSKREWERRDNTKERSVGFKCVLLSYPFPPIYRCGAPYMCLPHTTMRTSGMHLGANHTPAHGRAGSADPKVVWQTLVGPTCGGWHVGPWVHPRCTFESVWTPSDPLYPCGALWFAGLASLGLITCHGWAWNAWIKEVHFLLISYAKCLHSNVHHHLRKLSI
jgi:hypothetical protein